MFTMKQLFEKNGYPLGGLANPHITRAIAKKLTEMGYIKRIRRIDGLNANVWMRPEENVVPETSEVDLSGMVVPGAPEEVLQ